MTGLLRGFALFFITCALTASGQNVMMYDFEADTEFWENEAASPVPALHVTERARSGKGALGFEYDFKPGFIVLHVRVKEGFPKDYSMPGFLGFSAWVYISAGKPNWEAKMFVRTGQEWTLYAGQPARNLQPGWHRVFIGRDEIRNLNQIQDIGIQVVNFREARTVRILIDQVEAIMGPADPAQP